MKFNIFCLQVRAIRKKMCEIITRDVTNSELREVVNKLIPDSIAKDIEKSCHGIYPLRDVCIRKVRNNYLIVNCCHEDVVVGV